MPPPPDPELVKRYAVIDQDRIARWRGLLNTVLAQASRSKS
jgi:hypothetical protein